MNNSRGMREDVKNNVKYKKILRILVGIGAPLCAVSLALVFFLLGKTPPCLFYEVTGLYCVGCGAGRAALSLLNGNIFAAFRYNPLMITLLPLLAYYLLKVYIFFVFGKDVIPLPKFRARWIGVTLLIIIVSFWVMRNLPFAPFSYLAPTAT